MGVTHSIWEEEEGPAGRSCKLSLLSKIVRALTQAQTTGR